MLVTDELVTKTTNWIVQDFYIFSDYRVISFEVSLNIFPDSQHENQNFTVLDHSNILPELLEQYLLELNKFLQEKFFFLVASNKIDLAIDCFCNSFFYILDNFPKCRKKYFNRLDWWNKRTDDLLKIYLDKKRYFIEIETKQKLKICITLWTPQGTGTKNK